MNKSIKKKEATCEVEAAFSVIGGKWKPIILWLLGDSQTGTLRFSQLQHFLPDITHKILSKQLRELEVDKLIHRKVYPEVPPRVEYTITEIGKEVLPILDMLCEWTNKNELFGYKLIYNFCDDKIL